MSDPKHAKCHECDALPGERHHEYCVFRGGPWDAGDTAKRECLPKNAESSACGDCLLAHLEAGVCQHPDAGRKSWLLDESTERTPSWCPLRTAPLLITLRKP